MAECRTAARHYPPSLTFLILSSLYLPPLPLSTLPEEAGSEAVKTTTDKNEPVAWISWLLSSPANDAVRLGAIPVPSR